MKERKGETDRSFSAAVLLFSLFLFFPLPSPAPDLALLPSTYQIGTFSTAEAQKISFTLVNRGGRTIRLLKVLSTCDCLRVDAFPDSIRPGGRGVVKATLPAYSLSGLFTQYILVYTDQEPDSLLRLKATGTALPLLEILCDRPNHLSGPQPGGIWKGNYTLTATRQDLTLGLPRKIESGGTRSFHRIEKVSDAPLSYRITRTVNFSDQPLQSSTLEIPLRVAGLRNPPPPVRLELELVLTPPLSLLPDRIKIPYQLIPLKRRLNLLLPPGERLSAETPVPLLDAPPSGVTLHATPLSSRRGWKLILTFSAESIDALAEKGRGLLPVRQGRNRIFLKLETETP